MMRSLASGPTVLEFEPRSQGFGGHDSITTAKRRFRSRVSLALCQCERAHRVPVRGWSECGRGSGLSLSHKGRAAVGLTVLVPVVSGCAPWPSSDVRPAIRRICAPPSAFRSEKLSKVSPWKHASAPHSTLFIDAELEVSHKRPPQK